MWRPEGKRRGFLWHGCISGIGKNVQRPSTPNHATGSGYRLQELGLSNRKMGKRKWDSRHGYGRKQSQQATCCGWKTREASSSSSPPPVTPIGTCTRAGRNGTGERALGRSRRIAGPHSFFAPVERSPVLAAILVHYVRSIEAPPARWAVRSCWDREIRAVLIGGDLVMDHHLVYVRGRPRSRGWVGQSMIFRSRSGRIRTQAVM